MFRRPWFKSRPRTQGKGPILNEKGGFFCTTEATTGMSAVIGSMSTVTELMTAVWDMMTSNPLLTLILAVSLVGVDVAVFKKIKRAAK